MCHTWKCPGCGVMVGLPAAAPAPVDAQAAKRLNQVAQASCGCWVKILPERGVARLLEAIVNGDDEFCRPSRVIPSRRF
jgi:hypothetical protein